MTRVEGDDNGYRYETLLDRPLVLSIPADELGPMPIVGHSDNMSALYFFLFIFRFHLWILLHIYFTACHISITG